MKKDKVKVKFSIRWKLFAAVIGFAVIITTVTLTTSYFVYKSSSETVFGNVALSLAKTESKAINSTDLKTVKELILNKFNEVYTANGNKLPKVDTEEGKKTYLANFDFVKENSSFKNIQSSLDNIFKDNNNSVSSLYLGFIDHADDTFIFITDSTLSNEYCNPGWFDSTMLTKESKEFDTLPAKSQILEPYFDNSTTYGSLLIAAAPVLDTDDSLICHAYVDIDFAVINQQISRFINNLGWFVILFALVLTSGIVIVFNFTLVKPLRKLDDATTSYLNKEGDEHTTASEISKLEIKTYDEVEHLTKSIQAMEKNISAYIESIKAISAEKERYSTELDIAEKIQLSLLPHDFQNNDNYELFAFVNPAKEVGGDFYDFYMVDETHIALVMADVSGKGIPAALFMAISKVLLKDHVINSNNLSQTFTTVNNLLSTGNTADMFVTAYEGILDLETGEYKFVNAGHEMPFIYKKSTDRFEPYKCKPGFVLGGMPGVKYQEGIIKLEPGDKIFLYTDGVPEASDDSKNQFGMESLQRALRESKAKKPEDIIQEVNDRIESFVGDAPQFDDITMLCFEFKSKIEGKTKSIELGATVSNFDKALDFVNGHLEEHEIDMSTINKIDIALDELFSNVCNYAYDDGLGKIRIDLSITSSQIKISLIDDGKEYNPLLHEDPDITQSVKERQIGGLGIMMVKKIMDEVKYEYKHKQNIITIIKNI